MPWTFRCKCGNETGFVGLKPTSDGHDCDDCGAPRAQGQWVECETVGAFMGALLPEIPPHFNRSLDRHVESRAHLEHLQKKLGVQDYSPSLIKGPSSSWR